MRPKQFPSREISNQSVALTHTLPASPFFWNFFGDAVRAFTPPFNPAFVTDELAQGDKVH